jgi:hypothetical protein
VRRNLDLVVVLGGLAVGSAVAASRARSHRAVVTGTFPNGMGYARLGTGEKSLLWIGGPSIGAPKGPYLRVMTRVLRPFVNEGYTVWLLGLKPNLPAGCTITDLA